MDEITKSYRTAVQGLPPHLQRMASDLRSCRDMRGAWSLRDGDGNKLTPEPPPSASKAASGSRPVTSAAFLRVCEEIGELFGRVERRLEALESGGTKALHPGYVTKIMAPAKPRYRHHEGAWIVAGASDILAATSREATP